MPLKKITNGELQTILTNHKHWLNEDCDGWEDMRANLDYTDLDGFSLVGDSLDGAKYGDSEIETALSFGGFGRYRRTTNVLIFTDGECRIFCGCFKGNLEEFRAKVRETHAGTIHEKTYLAIADIIEIVADQHTKQRR